MLDLKPIRQRLVAIHTAEWLENAPDDIADLLNEVEKLRERNQVLTTAIQDHYDVWRTKNWRLRLAQNKWLWLAIGIPEDDKRNADG